jgi:two-component system alkaline phosphatase synthesis response regulator PhoP
MSDHILTNPIFTKAGILIVDDEEWLLEMVQLVCKQAGFKHVFTAKDGIEALRILQRNSDEIDLLSLDLNMPGMSGLKLAEIVANTHDRIVGLVMFTGFGNEEVKREFFALGSEVGVTEGFLSKPAQSEEILGAYANAIHDVFAKREKQLQIGVACELKHLKAAVVANAIDLSEIQETLGAVASKLDNVEKRVCEAFERGQPKTTSDLSYVWALTVVFLLVSGGLAWASEYFRLPLLSVLALASVTILVLMLIAVFDLSKGGKLSEKSLMEVLRKAFAFISKRRK